MGRSRAIQGEVEKRLLEALKCGCTIKLACEIVGISYETFRAESERNPVFAAEATRARYFHIPEALEQVRKAGKDDWRAAKAFLELVRPEDYSRRLELTGAHGSAVKLEVHDARERLLARLERLAEHDAAQDSSSEPQPS